MQTELYLLILGILGVWRVTHLLHAEDGPWNVVARLRRRAGVGFWAGLLDCFYCLSLWVAAPLAWIIGERVALRLLLWPALSAGAILLERMTTRPEPPVATPYWKEEDSDVLWTESTGGQRSGAARE